MDSNNPYTGKRITLISNSGIRYEGTLISVNPEDATVGLSKVRMFGTEERSVPNFVPPSNSVFDTVLFRGTDIREIALISDEPAPFVDPAVLEIHQPSAPSSQPAASNFQPPSVFPQPAAQRESSSGAQQSSSSLSHFGTGISPRGTQPPTLGNQSGANDARDGERAGSGEPDRFPSRQGAASQRPPFTNATNTTAASGRGSGDSKRLDGASASNSKPLSAPAAKPSTWAGVVTSAPKATRGTDSPTNSQDDQDARPRGNRDAGRFHRGGYQDQRGFTSARGGDFTSRGGRGGFFDREREPAGRERDRPAYAYAPRGSAAGWTRGGGDEMGGRRQGGLVGRGGAGDYVPQSAGQRGGFGFGFGNAPQGRGGSAFGGYGNQRENFGNRGSWRGGQRGEWRGGPRAGNDTRRPGGVPAEYQEEFDFETGNTQLAHELEKLHLDGKDGETAKAKHEHEDQEAEAADLGNALADDDDAASTQDSESHYDKSKSFFDTISSEVSATNKKPNWHKERQVNAETFGQAALRRGGGRGGRGRGGWRGGPRRGGYGFNNY